MANSSTGSTKPQVDMTNWRKTLQKGRIKFDDKKKQIYLDQLLMHGQKMKAAKAADVAYTTVQEHRENDPEFAEAEEFTLNLRSEIIVSTIEQEALAGEEVPVIADGEIVGSYRKFESGLRGQMLKAHDAKYKDKQDINLSGEVRSGVLVIPGGDSGGITSVLERAKQHREQMLQDQAASEAEEHDFKSNRP